MRGRLSEQDLTDYACNELQPEERLYVESLLAVSEPSREDVYRMIDLGQMLEEGFEGEESLDLGLTAEQRGSLVEFVRPVSLWHRAAASVAAVACAALLVMHPRWWHPSDSAGKVAEASSHFSSIVAAAMGPGSVRFAAPLANIAAMADDGISWLGAASDMRDPVVCTPPSWLDSDGSSVNAASL